MRDVVPEAVHAWLAEYLSAELDADASPPTLHRDGEFSIAFGADEEDDRLVVSDLTITPTGTWLGPLLLELFQHWARQSQVTISFRRVRTPEFARASAFLAARDGTRGFTQDDDGGFSYTPPRLTRAGASTPVPPAAL
jgi:hypothetical protein